METATESSALSSPVHVQHSHAAPVAPHAHAHDGLSYAAAVQQGLDQQGWSDQQQPWPLEHAAWAQQQQQQQEAGGSAGHSEDGGVCGDSGSCSTLVESQAPQREFAVSCKHADDNKSFFQLKFLEPEGECVLVGVLSFFWCMVSCMTAEPDTCSPSPTQA